MTRKSEVHIVPRASGWATVRKGSDRAIGTYATRDAAIRAGRKVAKEGGTELIVHGRDGRVRSSHSYDRSEGRRTVKPAPPMKGRIALRMIESAVDKLWKE
jgi:hypothetical protein